MKPQFRLFLWLSLLLLVGYGGIATFVATLRHADYEPAVTSSRQYHSENSGYHLAPQHQHASFQYTSGGRNKGWVEWFATEGSDDLTSQIQLKKHHPAVFNYFAGFYGSGCDVAYLFKARPAQGGCCFRSSTPRYIMLRVIRV